MHENLKMREKEQRLQKRAKVTGEKREKKIYFPEEKKRKVTTRACASQAKKFSTTFNLS